MQVCRYKGLVLAVLTRNEHCPPHVHTGTADWDARFTFSFWHDGVRLWDVTPAQTEPQAALLEALRLTLRHPAHLRRAREIWWQTRQTVCLEHQQWDMAQDEVVNPKDRRPGAVAIASATFDAAAYKTVLRLAATPHLLEIEL